ncbi:MAG: hydroxymethylbilane synthase [Acidobacteriota bacterium]
MPLVKVGSRGSKLALWQTDFVLQKLKEAEPDVDFEKVIIKTKGDKLLDVALSKIGDKGLFTKEIENELLAGNIDLAVHSMKDLPTFVPLGLTIGAVLARENPVDVLLAKQGLTLKELPSGARVGTSSLRRRAQLLMVRKDLDIVDLRGNIDTRVGKLEQGELDAIIVARAGIVRLGYQGMITEELDFLPAVGQGAIGIECRDGDSRILGLLARINDKTTQLTVEAERSFLSALEGGCQIPIGALAKIEGGEIILEGLVSGLEGNLSLRDTAKGPIDKAYELGKELARLMLDQGADKILSEIRSQENG